MGERMQRAGWMVMALVVVWACWVSPQALAVAIVADGDSSDWPVVLPTGPNTGHVVRTAAHEGVYVWRDALGDHRTDLGNTIDIHTFAVTASATHLHFLVTLGPNVAASRPQIQIAIDTDQVPNSGQLLFANYADTNVHPAAAWEFLIATRFGTAATRPAVFNTAWADLASAGAKNAIDAGPLSEGRVIEISVPWSDLGLPAGPSGTLRFTVAAFLSQIGSDSTANIHDNTISNAVDVVSHYGAPRAGAQANTWEEVQDLIVDHYLDVDFSSDPDGEPAPPVRINEIFFASAEDGLWFELFNASAAPVDLTGWRLSTASVAGGSGATLRFPADTVVAPGRTLVIAGAAAPFFALHGFWPDRILSGSHPLIPSLQADTAWASGTFSVASTGGALLLLDPGFSVQDVVVWGSGAYSGVTAFTAPGAAASAERSPSRRATWDGSADFVVRSVPTPGRATESCVAAQGTGHVAEGTPCDDGVACNDGAFCHLGTCGGGQPLLCVDDANPCTQSVCVEAYRGCRAPEPAGTPCPDDDLCSGPDTCDGQGSCVRDQAVQCPVPENACQLAVCDQDLGCFAPAELACDDGDPCTENGRCDGQGGCVSQDLTCPSDDSCSVGTCSSAAGGCVYTALADETSCQAADPCVEEAACSGGVCVGQPKNCSELDDACNVGRCDPTTGTCVRVPVEAGTPCDDGDPCTEGEICQSGSCYGGRDICTADPLEGDDPTVEGLDGADGADIELPQAEKKDEGGCGCTLIQGPPAPPLWWLGLLGLGGYGVWRRRRSRWLDPAEVRATAGRR